MTRELPAGRSRLLTSNTSNAVNDIVDHLLADGVVSTGVVVCSILLATDQKLRVVEVAVATGADLINGEGSRSTKRDRGTYLPLLVSVKNVS